MMRQWSVILSGSRWLRPDSGGSSGSRAPGTPGGEHEDIDIFPAIDPEGPVSDDSGDDLAPVEPILGKSDPVLEEDKTVTRIEIPFRTIAMVLGTILGVWLILQITQILLLVFISFLIALALVPPLRYLENRGMGRVTAAGLTFLVLVGSIVGYFALIVPPLIDQGQSLIDNFPEYTSRFERVIERYPSINERYLEIKENGLADDTTLPWSSVVEVGTTVVGTVANIFFVLVLSFYLLLEGDRSYRFLGGNC